jgi:hypothetical protein
MRQPGNAASPSLAITARGRFQVALFASKLTDTPVQIRCSGGHWLALAGCKLQGLLIGAGCLVETASRRFDLSQYKGDADCG